MHLWQAIKMASKSLWTNKMRSFLTMLGIIIGVMTVALLTSVASGVQSAVVSQIRTQSTLSIMMCSSNNMTYGKVKNVLSSNQHEETDDDYYTYSLVYSNRSVISQDLTGVSQDTFYEEFNSLLLFNSISITQEQLDSMTDSEKQLVQLFMAQSKKTKPTSATVYAVDSNFADVYKMDYEGDFPKADDELLVDQAFVDAYLSEVDDDDVIGSTVSIGIEYYTELKLSFVRALTDVEINNVLSYIQGTYEVAGENETTSTIGLSLTIVPNLDDSLYVWDEENNTLSVNIEFLTTSTNDEMKQKLSGNYTTATAYDTYVAPFYKEWLVADGVSVSDVYDISNQRVYKVVGVLSEESSSFMSNMTSGSDKDDDGSVSIFDMMLASSKGSCYTILSNDNLASLGVKENITSKEGVSISYAYLRFKTEDVMDERVNDLSVALISSGMMYMSDFMIVSMSSVASIVDNVMDTLTIMLTVISIVSLIVGGIGIMNIMLVAVTERTREIGIRKAIGAKRSAILVQFLVEALMLAILGGAIGLGISAIGCAIIGHFIGFSISIPLWVIGMSIGFCTAIGLIFGMFPAIKASHMQPIDALRRE